MNKETVQDSLKAFYTHMHKWETECARRDAKCENGLLDYEESERIGMNEYHEIFSAFCTDDATPRDFYYSDPPEYDPSQLDIERVENADNGTALVYLRILTNPNERVLIRLIREGDGWRIDDKRFIAGTGEVIEANL